MLKVVVQSKLTKGISLLNVSSTVRPRACKVNTNKSTELHVLTKVLQTPHEHIPIVITSGLLWDPNALYLSLNEKVCFLIQSLDL